MLDYGELEFGADMVYLVSTKEFIDGVMNRRGFVSFTVRKSLAYVKKCFGGSVAACEPSLKCLDDIKKVRRNRFEESGQFTRKGPPQTKVRNFRERMPKKFGRELSMWVPRCSHQRDADVKWKCFRCGQQSKEYDDIEKESIANEIENKKIDLC